MSSENSLRKSLKYLVKCFICSVFEILSMPLSLLYAPQRNKIPAIDDKILLMPAIELSKRIKTGDFTSEQVVRSYIKRIELVNPIINAVVHERFKLALEEAREIDKQIADARKSTKPGGQAISLLDSPLIGVPVTIKECIALEGGSFTSGLPSRSFKKSAKDALVVKQLRRAGLVPIALTNIPSLCFWWDSYNLLYGRTNNPYDLSRIPGGSSGGEGAILAAAGSVVGVGSDTAGSIRIPCNFCAIFGHKPTPHCVSTQGLFPAMHKEQENLRGVGPMSRYACDLLPMLKLMVDEDKLELLKLDEPVDLTQINIYYCEDLGDPLVSACNEDILFGLRAAAEHLSSSYRVPSRKVCLEEFRYGLDLFSAEFKVSRGHLYETEAENGIPVMNPFAELINSVLGSSDYTFNTIFCAALDKFQAKYGSPRHRFLSDKAVQLRKRFYDLVGDNGVLLMPTHPQPAPKHQATIPKMINAAYTAVANALHAPITQCPLGMTKEGLPYGIQLIAKPYNDRILLAIAQELEKAFGGWLSPARIAA